MLEDEIRFEEDMIESCLITILGSGLQSEALQKMLTTLLKCVPCGFRSTNLSFTWFSIGFFTISRVKYVHFCIGSAVRDVSH